MSGGTFVRGYNHFAKNYFSTFIHYFNFKPVITGFGDWLATFTCGG
jgi:hypothetical protein